MFGTSGVRGRVGETVTADLAVSIGRGLATDGADTVVVGRDARESGAMLVRALVAGVTECGGDVVDVGVASTPAVARSVPFHGADAGVVVTASHNPPEDNGIKLWDTDGSAFGPDRRDRIAGVVERDAYDLAAWDGIGDVERDGDAADRHREALAPTLPSGFDGPVVVDVGNGTGRVTADALHEAGCAVQTLNGQPDGRFPGRPSEPTAETCEALRAHVAATDAVLGIAHDGDADRMLAVDEAGRFVPGDALLALFAREAAGPGDLVAAPVDTSLAVDDALDAVGAELVHTRVGDTFVAERARQPDVAFGGEPSGAWIWPDQTLCPDGPLAACTLTALVAEAGPLGALVDDLPSYPIRRENLEVDGKRAVMSRVEAAVDGAFERVNTLDGVRVETDDGWFLIRASGTQPLIRVTAEARDPDAADSLRDRAVAIVRDAKASE